MALTLSCRRPWSLRVTGVAIGMFGVLGFLGCGKSQPVAPLAPLSVRRAADKITETCDTRRYANGPSPSAAEVRARGGDVGVLVADYRRHRDKQYRLNAESRDTVRLRELLQDHLDQARAGLCAALGPIIASAVTPSTGSIDSRIGACVRQAKGLIARRDGDLAFYFRDRDAGRLGPPTVQQNEKIAAEEMRSAGGGMTGPGEPWRLWLVERFGSPPDLTPSDVVSGRRDAFVAYALKPTKPLVRAIRRCFQTA